MLMEPKIATKIPILFIKNYVQSSQDKNLLKSTDPSSSSKEGFLISLGGAINEIRYPKDS